MIEAANDNDIRWVYTHESLTSVVNGMVSRGRPPEEARALAIEMYEACGYTYVDVDPCSTMTI